MKQELLRIYNCQIRVNPCEALAGMNLNLLEGEALGMVFANLYEKEALLKVLQGERFFTAGRMYINERIVISPKTVQKCVYVIYRQPRLNDGLSIVENVFFSALPLFLTNLDRYRLTLLEIFKRFGISVDINSPPRKLSSIEKIAIELVKAYVLKKRIIVLADLSLTITASQMDHLMQIVERMKKWGFSFIIIENFLDMVFHHTENIAIIKGGRTTGLFSTSTVETGRMRAFFQRDAQFGAINDDAPRHVALPPQRDVAFRFDRVGTDQLNDLSFSIPRGELTEILYTDGQSRDNFLDLIRGKTLPTSGHIYINGKALQNVNARSMREHGLCIIEGNPQEKMLLTNMSVFDNIALSLPGHVVGLWMKRRFRKSMRARTEELCGEDIWDAPLQTLSSVQLQKLVYVKQLLYHPAVLVCVNPFTGMDYQVDGVTEAMIEMARVQGAAVLVVTSYLSEFEAKGKRMYLSGGMLFFEGR